MTNATASNLWSSDQDSVRLPAVTRPVKCLLVEDSALDRSLMRYSAERAGVEIEFVDAATLSQARTSLLNEDFDLIILDQGLPDGDGLDLRADLCKATRNRDVPTIMVSGRDDPGTEELARIAGCVDFLSKQDLSPDELSRVLRSVLKQADPAPDQSRFEITSTEFELLLQALDQTKRIRRQKPLVSRLVALISELRRDLDIETVEVMEELSEIALMLWMEVDTVGDKPAQPEGNTARRSA